MAIRPLDINITAMDMDTMIMAQRRQEKAEKDCVIHGITPAGVIRIIVVMPTSAADVAPHIMVKCIVRRITDVADIEFCLNVYCFLCLSYHILNSIDCSYRLIHKSHIQHNILVDNLSCFINFKVLKFFLFQQCHTDTSRQSREATIASFDP